MTELIANPALGDTDRGYAVSVGRIREDESGIFDIKFVALSHNSKSKRQSAPVEDVSHTF